MWCGIHPLQESSPQRPKGVILFGLHLFTMPHGYLLINNSKYCLCVGQPSNIMVGSKGELKIVDFGLVTPERDEEGNVMEKTIGTGTRSFMAPEQVRRPVLESKKNGL